MKQIFHEFIKKFNINRDCLPPNKHSRLHSPQISCHVEYHGTEYGGWMVCPDNLSEESVVYSFGVGDDASFDLDLIETYGAQIYAFDPTPRSIQWVKDREWPTQFHFYPYGIAASDGLVKFFPPKNPEFISHTILGGSNFSANEIFVEMKQLSTIIDLLDHTRIDILKMDIEGAEYEVIPEILNLSNSIEIKQLLIEFHHFFPNITNDKTIEAVNQLTRSGYRLFSVSDRNYEYGFIKL